MSRHHNRQNVLRVTARLMLNDVTVHHVTVLYMSSIKQMFYLNYPRPPPKQRGNWSVRLDAFSVTTSSVDFKAAWLFSVPFSFLPYNRIVLHLLLRDQENCQTLSCVHGSCKKYINSPYNAYCQCHDNWAGKYCNVTAVSSCTGVGKFIDQFPTPICACPLGRMNDECRVLFHPCGDVQCRNDGTCLPSDERQSTKYMCSCADGYHGFLCQLKDARVDIYFSRSFPNHNNPLLPAIFVHFLELRDASDGILFGQNRLLYKQVHPKKPLYVFNNNHEYLPSFILLQVFFSPHKFDYFVAAIIKGKMQTNISTTIYESNRCPHVNELLLNKTVRNFPLIKKVKFYHRVCKVSNAVKWFHDEAYLCFCNKDRLADCLFFPREPTQCSADFCYNNGQCVQNNINGIWDFGCVCGECTSGSLCQLKTSQYALSLDAMLGQDILENVPVVGQPVLIKLVFAVVIIMFLTGLVSNFLSLMTFKQPRVQEVGCGIYLFYLALVGQLGLLMLTGQFFYLLGTAVYKVNNRSAARWSCVTLEYFLGACQMLFDWLTACVAIERSVNMIKGIYFRKPDSVWWAKRVVFLLTTVVLVSTGYEPFIRQVIDDPRATTQHTWCVVTFSQPWLKVYRLSINLINLFIPCLINLITMILLLHKSTRMKEALARQHSKIHYFTILKKQLPLYGSPVVLVILSLMRLVFSFTLICIIHQWQKYVYLTAYLISFAPLMGTFPIFVLPATMYKIEFEDFCKRTRRKLRIG